MLTITHKGNLDRTYRFLKKVRREKILPILHKYGQIGVKYLAENTPVRTGLTANSWSYEVEEKKDLYRIIWKNSNVRTGIPVAILLQYGHATGTGGWVKGIDYINPALSPVFEFIAEEAWKELNEDE